MGGGRTQLKPHLEGQGDVASILNFRSYRISPVIPTSNLLVHRPSVGSAPHAGLLLFLLLANSLRRRCRNVSANLPVALPRLLLSDLQLTDFQVILHVHQEMAVMCLCQQKALHSGESWRCSGQGEGFVPNQANPKP